MDPVRLERVRQLSRRYVEEGKVPFSQVLVAHHGVSRLLPACIRVRRRAAVSASAHWCCALAGWLLQPVPPRARLLLTDTGPLTCTDVYWLQPRSQRVILRDSSGYLDVENQVPVQDDTIVRIYSMSKPIACAAALICYELGHFEMEQPVELYLPEFKGMQVWNAETGELEPCRRRMNIKHLFMHTSGLGGGGGGTTHRDKYREIVKAATASVSGSEADDLAESARRMAALPLAFHPGDMCVCHN
jgi:CubicO group peptidase (beta-lactamase class C family)